MYKEELINLKVKRSELEDNIQNTIVQLQPYKEKGKKREFLNTLRI